MFNIDQDYFNEIAAQGKLKYEINQKLFSLPTDEMNELSDQYFEEFTKFMQNRGLTTISVKTAASILMQLLPLYLESEAIGNYITEKDSWILYNALPEVLSPKEGLMILLGDHMGIDPTDWPVLIDAVEVLAIRLKRTEYGKLHRHE